ncbi:hypothetical protein JTB14_014306 [Gonioctena quinquepunctata]|nr:hypothetical protein JTB14_014306 [Gonioctena quinquepunctata]
MDCTEFRIQCPSKADNKIFCYSNYKNCFTAKLLIGITPSGFTSLKTKLAGGRKSHSQLTVESALIDLLEEGDIVLADKGFPQIKQTLDAGGKKVTVVMPHILKKKKTEFSKEETEATYI